MNAISAGHEATLRMAKEVLRMGGNAFDAAITAHLTMYLSEPCMASAGAGGFALCFTPKDGVKMLDFFTQTPLRKSNIEEADFYPIHVNFGNETEEFHIGAASMATPGSIAGLYELHKRYGSLPINELIDPVIDLAKNGVPLDEFQYIDMGLLEPILRSDPEMQDVFFANGALKKVGEIIQFPHYENFLEFLKQEGTKGFYKGEIGQKVAEYSKSKGGFLNRSDFENYKVHWRDTLTANYHNNTLHVPNGPSIGGAIMLLLLANFKDQNLNDLEAISKTLTDCGSLSNLDRLISHHYPLLTFDRVGKQNATKGTSHFNILDKWGNAIAFTCSIGEGSGYFIPGTDMQMNNMLGESFLLPNGFHSWDIDVRLNSMMTPTMILEKNQLRFLSGSGGAGRIPYMILQTINRYFLQALNLEKATSAPRLYLHDETVHYESGYKVAADWIEQFPSKEWTEKSLFFGGVHSISINSKGMIEAEGDKRRFGVSEVF